MNNLRRLISVLVALSVLCCTLPAFADRRDVPPAEQLDNNTLLWLARSQVGEAGWLSRDEHVAIAYTYARRWRTRKAQVPGITYLDMIFAQSRALDGDRPWILELNEDGTQPPSWPAKLSWEKHRKWWMAVLSRTKQWAEGKLADPCPGTVAFGGKMDTKPDGTIPALCMFENTFYVREDG